ncbi:MAG TPA: TIGR03118 family protein [Puia sp.]|nr:TIGR03118 family protein [Puia sp.]
MNKLNAFLIAAVVLTLGCRKSNVTNKDLRDFTQVNLVDNNGKYAATHMDPTLMNAWGLAFSSGGIAWVNSNGGGVSEVYTADGALVPARPAVNIPSPTDTAGGNPTGIVFAGGKGFRLSNGSAANFLFVTEDGILAGWNGPAGNNAIRIKNFFGTASFKGMAISSWGSNNYIYAADFKGGKIWTWDTGFAAVSMPFHDPGIPSGFAPFNIQAVGSWLFVTYAKVGPTGDDVAGPGNGFVSIFKPDGSFVTRFASRGWLNSPWGVTAAGNDFLEESDMDDMPENHGEGGNSGPGKHGGMGDNHHDLDSVILVGNFGDGRINAFSLEGKFLGQLQSHKRTIVIEGLWALSFAPTTSTVDQRRLYFTAGPDDEKDGLFGYLIKQ